MSTVLAQAIDAPVGWAAHAAWVVWKDAGDLLRSGIIQETDEWGYPVSEGACECCDAPLNEGEGWFQGMYEYPGDGSTYCDNCFGGLGCDHGVPMPCEVGVPHEPYDHGDGPGVCCVWCWTDMNPSRTIEAVVHP